MSLNITKTIRFKMTLTYSVILFVFSSLIVILLNLYLNAFLSVEPPKVNDPRPLPNNGANMTQQERDRYEEELEKRENEQFKEARKEDIRKVQTMSFISLFPLALLSFGIGYYISGQFLNPLHELNLKIKKLKAENLGEKLSKEAEDEIGDLIDSFNEMSVNLDKAFKIQTEFVQDASHELKTPLTIITTNLDTILDDEEASIEELRRAISKALDGMNKVNRLTQNLLTLSLPSDQRRDEVDFVKLVKEQVASLKDFAKEKSVGIKTSYPKDNILIEADSISLGRSIYNLIENAIKYSSEEERDSQVEVVIEGGQFTPKENRSKRVSLKVIDNGPGIPTEYQSKIFDRFYRIDKSRSRKSGGFGLGLAIVKKIVEEHGGEISVESEEGRTVFEVVL